METQGMSDHRHYDPSHLYRNRETGVIMGVCAGLAEFFDVEAWLVRVAAVVSLWFFTVPTAVAYVVLGLILRDRPLSYSGQGDEHYFWSARRTRGSEYR